MASENGHLEVVKLLLADPRVDPSDYNNIAIQAASKNGQLEVVRLLLSHPRVNPSDYGNDAIKVAFLTGHLEVVRLLLSDRRMDPSVDDNLAIRWASKNGHLEFVKLLLSHPRVDPSAQNNDALRQASRNGSVDIVLALICHPKVDPNAAEINNKMSESLLHLIQVAKDVHGIQLEDLQKMGLHSLSDAEWDMLMQRNRGHFEITVGLLKKFIGELHIPEQIIKQQVWQQVFVLIAKHGPIPSKELRGRLLQIITLSKNLSLTGVAEVDARIIFHRLLDADDN
jgi:hypothetical protein